MSLLRICQCMQQSSRHFTKTYRVKSISRLYSTEILTSPSPSDSEKKYPEKLKRITEEISKLTLLEVSELNSLLKKTLNIPDAPIMSFGAAPAAPPAEEEEEVVTKEVKTSFTVRLTSFQQDKKIALIKEIKNLMEGMNLVQAKKFVEELPQAIKVDVSKDEAERLKQAIENVGGTCEID